MNTYQGPQINLEKQQNVIRFWNVLEYLSPFDLQRTLAESLHYFRLNEGFQEKDLPWGNPEKLIALGLPRGKNYKYTIYFGVFEVEAAMSELRRVLDVEPPSFSDPASDTTCFGSFRVGEDGYPAPESLSLSALPWAVGHLAGDDLRAKLRDTFWSDLFGSYRTELYSLFFEDADLRERRRRPFDPDLLTDLSGAALRAADWYPKVTPLAYCVIDEDKRRRPAAPPGEGAEELPAHEPGQDITQGGVEEDTPGLVAGEPSTQQDETTILNSFYAQDLERVFLALSGGDVGSALARYLDEEAPADRSNLLDRRHIVPWCAPRMMPIGRWASDDSQYQSLMQQVAINIARATLDKEGVFSVNGPPGTGKTTMLRDLIADIIVQRAVRLAEFDSPEAAFTEGSLLTTASGKSFSAYRLDPRLTGFEMVVASSNNGAVENVTREIPGDKAVGEDYRGRASYFTEVAQYCLKPDDKGVPPWGLIAAVLGNSRNRFEFTQKFWLDKPEEEESLLELPKRMTLRRHLNERVSSGRLDWSRARAGFEAARSRVVNLVNVRDEWAQAVAGNRAIQAQLPEAEALASEEKERYEEAAGALRQAARVAGRSEKALCTQLKVIEAIERGRPNAFLFFIHSLHRVFAVSKVANYEERMGDAQGELDRIREELKQHQAAQEDAQERLEQSRGRHDEAVDALTRLKTRYQQNEQAIIEGRAQLGVEAFADEQWWTRDERAVQLRAPWLDAELNRARAELFLAALRLHQVFIEVARYRFRRNISLWSDMMTGKLVGAKAEEILTLWQTFFLVVPVVSTTFASVGRMFARLGRESLGWLLIDEAGQATPQAAVGALWRTKRAVIVGDPLQIEPVVSLEDPIINRLAELLNLSQHWRPSSSGTGASVQRLADYVNAYGGIIGDDAKALWVGCPLRMHRRCSNPMFDISNKIAYEENMIKESDDAPPEGHPILGVSSWISVGGSCVGKQWVPEQGQRVLRMLSKLKSTGEELPKVFVISPFRDVAFKLTQLLEKEQNLWAPNGVKDWRVKQWLKRSVGTVHTFQGKEAPVVIFLLGTDHESYGARGWASSKPNILNVAATRAQKYLYIVGDENLWKELNYFDTGSERLKKFSKNVE